MYDVEYAPPHVSERCECCGNRTIALTRFVSRDGEAYAVYYARYANGHPEDEIVFAVSIGEWHDDSEPAQRTAFFCRMRADGVMLVDPQSTPWADVELLGQRLSREQALAHPLKDAAFEVIDHAYEHDRSIAGYFHRAECGDTAQPLERSYSLPDVIFDIPEEDREGRVKAGRSFAELDGTHYFVRCLVPFVIENLGEWTVGAWIEVSQADHRAAWDAWDDPSTYAELRFEGQLANDLRELVGAGALGAHLSVAVRDPEQPPLVMQTREPELQQRMTAPWNEAAFTELALTQGLL